jgi:hypothetical protein
MQTAIVGTSSVSIRTETADGVAVTPSAVTVAGTAHDGTTVVLSGVTIGSPVVGTHTATLTVLAPTLVTLTWTVDGTVSTDPVDVIGRMPIAVSELRNSDSTLTSLDGAAARDAIELAHDECRRITGRSWVRRYDVASFVCRRGRVVTSWSDIARVGSVKVDGVAWTAQQIIDSTEIDPGTGVVEVAAVAGSIVEIGVEHGRREPSPQVRNALLIRARQFAQTPTSKVSLYSERVVVGQDGGSVVRMLPTEDSTGVAEVDAVYHRSAWLGGVGFA